MHGRILKSCSSALLVALACVAPISASAQQTAPGLLQFDPAYANAPAFRLTSASHGAAAPTAGDLTARVADLEATLKKIQEKEAAAKNSAAGKPSVRAGGRIQMDWASFDQNDVSRAQAGDFKNGTEFRRARIFLSGDAFDVIDYKIQFDFAESETVRDKAGTGQLRIGQVDFKDVYITVNELPVLGHVRVGHYKIPFGLEQLTSAKYLTFMERALPVDQGFEGRRTGVMAFDHNDAETFTWALCGFVTQIPENPPIYKNDGGGTGLAMRYTFLPWYDEASGGRGLWHTGIGYVYGDIANGNPVQVRQRPEAHLAERVVDTGVLPDVADVQSLGLETAFVYGPFSAQAEYNNFWLNRTQNADAHIQGAYAYVSYFLTGEHRPYDRTGGYFDRVKPFESFFRVRDGNGNVQMGKGAWEIAYRFSYFDLNDSGVIGGVVRDHTAGLNWYLNPYTRMMFNYVYSETTDHPKQIGVGRANILETRFEINF